MSLWLPLGVPRGSLWALQFAVTFFLNPWGALGSPLGPCVALGESLGCLVGPLGDPWDSLGRP